MWLGLSSTKTNFSFPQVSLLKPGEMGASRQDWPGSFERHCARSLHSTIVRLVLRGNSAAWRLRPMWLLRRSLSLHGIDGQES